MSNPREERASAPKTVDKDEVYETLVEEILTGELAPGTPVSERELVARFGISRTPIRQVMWRLAQNDLVTMQPNYGTFVKKLAADEILELFELREALEPMACALAAARRPQDELEDVQRLFQEAESDADVSAQTLVAMGGRLHDAIIRWSGNRMLERVYQAMRMQTQLMRNMLHSSLESELQSVDDHRTILEAIARRDTETARKTMTEHLQRSGRTILRNLFDWRSEITPPSGDGELGSA